ncbi:MAG: tRNA preQ1(34) S-adenosylmethionine ribosyltransferase-isomerase QueA [Desulfamplus sp.]|nr:tRNA preQ1(34) S-adenosylmethionine ribosyltransferase-isomerase QueA [Desulfamplus sp.]
MYSLSDYKYYLPDALIAQHPAKDREQSRLLRLNRVDSTISHHHFKDIENILLPDDLLVINNTRVVPARLKGYKESGGRVEVLIIDYIKGVISEKERGYFECECMIRASKSPKPGTILQLGIKEFGFDVPPLKARVEAVNEATFTVRFFKQNSQKSFDEILEDLGEIPLPPYIRRDNTNSADQRFIDDKEQNDKQDYQTIYATEKGAVAAPTAGLHFTKSLIERLTAKGVEFANITLHVGYGTFVPVRVDDIREHKMHSEFFSIPKESAEAINRAKSEGRRVIGVGTTSVRTLEYASDKNGKVYAGSKECNLFIYPGYKFKVVDAIITNFHLPESTLLMLVSAFAGREAILKAYKEAIDEKYRFFSYGDAMFLE